MTEEEPMTAPEAEPESTTAEEAPPAQDAAEATDAMSAVVKTHMDHATMHGLVPGGTYALSTHGDPTPIEGVLVGTNELGLLMHALGSRLLSFHPWSSIKSLVHSR